MGSQQLCQHWAARAGSDQCYGAVQQALQTQGLGVPLLKVTSQDAPLLTVSVDACSSYALSSQSHCYPTLMHALMAAWYVADSCAANASRHGSRCRPAGWLPPTPA